MLPQPAGIAVRSRSARPLPAPHQVGERHAAVRDRAIHRRERHAHVGEPRHADLERPGGSQYCRRSTPKGFRLPPTPASWRGSGAVQSVALSTGPRGCRHVRGQLPCDRYSAVRAPGRRSASGASRCARDANHFDVPTLSGRGCWHLRYTARDGGCGPAQCRSPGGDHRGCRATARSCSAHAPSSRMPGRGSGRPPARARASRSRSTPGPPPLITATVSRVCCVDRCDNPFQSFSKNQGSSTVFKN